LVIPEASPADAPPELRPEGVPYPDGNQALDITSIQIGLAIGFGPVFLFGVVAWVLYLFGQTLGPGFAQALVWSQLATISALIGLVFLWDGERAGALGLRKPSGLDVELGLGLAVVLLVIETATASYLPILYSSEAGALTSSLWLPITWPFTLVTQLPLPPASALIIAMVVSEELAVRGYAVDRLERLTQSTLLGAGGALMLDLVAHAPLWGLDYTICFIQAEMILTWLYVSERRLLPCLMGHLALDLLPLMLLALHFPLLASPPPAMNPLTMRGMELMDRREFKQAIAEFDQALQQNAKDATAYQERGAAYTPSRRCCSCNQGSG
jgi:uncharacterized protein